MRRIPPLVLLGAALMVAGGAFDVVVHLGSVADHAHGDASLQHAAHLLGIAGMALVLAGVAIRGARRHHRRSAASHGGLDPNAHR